MTSIDPAALKVGDIVHLTLGQLIAAKDNPRKEKEKGPDPILVASIRSRGLLQNLGVRPSEKSPGKFEVKYGSRRHAALKALVKEGHFKKEDTFLCRIASENPADREEEQIAENIARKAMNPVDEFEAFVRLEEKGLAIDEIAARFGADVRAVKQRLALGQAAPCVRKALRAGEITLEVAKIFAGSPDLARQERVFKEINNSGHFSAHYVKRRLHEDALSDKDDIVRFVTVDAYKAAVGPIEKDLFTDERRLLDVELVYRLRNEKLAREVERLTGEGWSWVEAREGYSCQITNGFDRLYGAVAEKVPETGAEIEKLEAELAELEIRDEDAMTEDDWGRLDEIENRLGELSTVERAFSADQKSVSGCIIYPRRDGVEIVEGLVRKEDRKKVAALRKKQVENGESVDERDFAGVEPEGEDDASSGPEYGLGLRTDLAVFKAQALQAALAMNPEPAILACQFILVYRVFKQPHHHWPSGTTLSGASADLRVGNGELGETRAAAILDRRESQVRTDIFAAGDWREAWSAFEALGQADREALVALAFARTVESMSGAGTFTALVASEMDIDIRSYWKPTAENFFARIKKDQLAQFLKETVGEDEAARLSKDGKAKKSELVDICEGLIDETRPVAATHRQAIDAWVPKAMTFDAPPRPDPDDEFEDWDEDADDEDVKDAPDDNAAPSAAAEPEEGADPDEDIGEDAQAA